jgi:hypothetical protein
MYKPSGIRFDHRSEDHDSFRIAATNATLMGLPAARRRR